MHKTSVNRSFTPIALLYIHAAPSAKPTIMKTVSIIGFLLYTALLLFSCKKNNPPPDPGNGGGSPIPLPSQKCYLSAVLNANGVTIRKLQLNSTQPYDVETDRFFSAAGVEREYYKYYNKEIQGNKLIFQEYHIMDGSNDYINGYYLYHINKANNLFLDSVEYFICTSGQCRAGGALTLSDYTRLASEVYAYNSNYKLQKKQYYDDRYQPNGHTTYSYNATGLLIKEEIYKADLTLSSSVEYVYSSSGKDFAFKGEPSQIEKLLFGYARSIQEYTTKIFSTATGASEIKWIINRYDDNSNMKGYLKSIAPESSPAITTAYTYTCE